MYLKDVSRCYQETSQKWSKFAETTNIQSQDIFSRIPASKTRYKSGLSRQEGKRNILSTKNISS